VIAVQTYYFVITVLLLLTDYSVPEDDKKDDKMTTSKTWIKTGVLLLLLTMYRLGPWHHCTQITAVCQVGDSGKCYLPWK